MRRFELYRLAGSALVSFSGLRVGTGQINAIHAEKQPTGRGPEGCVENESAA
jgi:hypothetical protein